MALLQDAAANVQAAADALQTVATDTDTLIELVAALKNAQGNLTPEQQTAVDAINATALSMQNNLANIHQKESDATTT